MPASRKLSAKHSPSPVVAPAPGPESRAPTFPGDFDDDDDDFEPPRPRPLKPCNAAAARRPSALPLAGCSTSAAYCLAAARPAAASCSSSKGTTAAFAPSNAPPAVCPADALALSAESASARVPAPCITSCRRSAARAGASSADSAQACHCG